MLAAQVSHHPVLSHAFEYALRLCETAFTPQCVLDLATPGMYAVIDRADRELVSDESWHCHKPHSGSLYVRRSARRNGRKENESLYLHKVLLGDAADGLDVDHIDRNGLNNSRSNLRVATRSQNLANRGKTRANTSGYKGVFARGRRWLAQIKVNGEAIRLGTYETREEAARAYDKGALKFFGEFAYLNFSEGN